MTDIVDRLREGIIVDAFGDGRIQSGFLADRLIRERHDAADKIEGLEADLCSAIEVAWNHGAKDWVRANYKANADLFEQGD